MAGPEKLLGGARRNSGRRDSGQAAVSGQQKPLTTVLGSQNISKTVKNNSNGGKVPQNVKNLNH